MEFCLEKYAKVTFRKGNLISSAAVELNIDRTICELDQDESYKYLDIDKKKNKKKQNGIRHIKMKKKIRKEC